MSACHVFPVCGPLDVCCKGASLAPGRKVPTAHFAAFGESPTVLEIHSF